MKRISFLGIACLLALALSTPLSAAEKPLKPSRPRSTELKDIKKDPAALNIARLASFQMYRYGREMYQRGNYAEAVRVFAKMLRLDCHNKVARYQLQKIADTVPAYANLKAALKNSSCPEYDFAKEDFLPASVYYENDPDIVLEQLLISHRRERLLEDEMNEKAGYYNAMLRELELTIAALLQGPAATSGVPQETLERLQAGGKIAAKVEKEITLLKSRLASQQLLRQQEVQELRTRLAEAEARVADAALAPEKPPAPAATARSREARLLEDAVARAKAELENKQAAVIQKEKDLMPLQAKFDAIQEKLKAIQEDLARKNARIQEIQANLNAIRKP
jgi:hypothetical protein